MLFEASSIIPDADELLNENAVIVFVLGREPELVHAVKEDAANISVNNTNNFFMTFLLFKNGQTT